jgi:hypothetical protein
MSWEYDNIVSQGEKTIDALREIYIDKRKTHDEENTFMDMTLFLTQKALGNALDAVGLAGALTLYVIKDQEARDEVAAQTCPTTGVQRGNVDTVDGRWSCCGGLWPDHKERVTS